ncbi:MAG: acetate--CoA ligase family protein [Sulfuricurvum sp.]|uniref:acetate--CoA ligase family protein n=1 Tax=Sulfuricurvum sp. TaxID=2025608 RepID=UPI00262E95A3|nr:acetate--CoA ligase family protein [Sulfuricurvum sp.]MDD5159023.1 acetate--CoA ligase family protein [Sulfuricurvum sp.]
MLESELYPLLSQSGFQIPRFRRFALNEPIALDFYPVALKVESPKIIHKSDIGGVSLSLSDNDALETARTQMVNRIAEHGIVLDPQDGFIATAMIQGEELFAGVVDDPIFGQIILFGKGGVLLELYRDVCYIDIHADEAEIIRALHTTKISKLFEGFRGSKPMTAEIVKFIQILQRFIKTHPNIRECDLNPVIFNAHGLHVVDARIDYHKTLPDNTPVTRHRNNFFDNRTVAVIGASTDPNKVGYAIARNALSFSGKLYLVNQKGGSFDGHPLLSSLDDINDTIDTAVITIPSHRVLETIEALIPKGVKNLIIVSAGFKEIGDTQSEERLSTLAQQHNLNIIGPNCLGYFEAKHSLNLTFGSPNIHKGSLALIAQSGAVLSSLMDKATQEGIGFSHILSAGNMADMNFADIIAMLTDSPECEAISLYAEGIRDGKAFLNSLRNCPKPIRVYKAGKSPQARKAAFSHTGNLSGDYPMFQGLLESVGVKIVDSLEALLYPRSFDNIAIITNAGGPGTILTDCIIERGAKLYTLTVRDIDALNAVLPSNWSNNNPIDIIGDAQSERFEAALRCVDAIEAIEMIYLLITPQMMTDTLNIVRLLEYPWKKPIYPILLGGAMMSDALSYLRKHTKPCFTTLHEASAFL